MHDHVEFVILLVEFVFVEFLLVEFLLVEFLLVGRRPDRVALNASSCRKILNPTPGNGFVDFEDLTVLLAAWNQNVSAAEGNLVDACGTPVDFQDLTVLLAAWTGPGAAGAPQAAVVRSDRLGPVDQDRMNPVTTSTSASARQAADDDDDVMLKHNLRATRRTAARSRSAGGIYGRLQAGAVDRAMGEEGLEATLVRHSLSGRRRDRL